MSRARRFAALYTAWIVLCAILFAAMRHAPDPSHRAGRILADAAGDRAVIVLRQRGWTGYEAVHVAYEKNRWIVLCDRVPHTALEEALVVELRAVDGAPIAVRNPVK